jgi:transcriptional regulator with XRE-family HTH domain
VDHETDELPVEYVEIDQIVARNMRYWRREAGLTQEELGEMLGWSAANISHAERSAEDGRDLRRFNAHTIVSLAVALGVPIAALFLPPADDGVRVEYLFRVRDESEELGMTALVRGAVMPDSEAETPVMTEYRGRFNAAARRYLDPDWAATVAHWLEKTEGPEAMADRAARLRDRRDDLLRAAAEYSELAAAVDPREEST